MPWSEVRLAGHSCDIFEPAIPNRHGFALIYFHGVHLSRLSDKPIFTVQFERYGIPVVAPLTARTWWTDRICPEFDTAMTAERYVVDHVVRFLNDRFEVAPPRIGLFGTSMGGQGALRFAFKYPSRFPVVAAISPAIDYHLRWNEGDETLPQMYPDAEAARQDTAILHVHPLNWPRNIWFACDPSDTRWHDSADRLHMKLAALGIPHVCDLETTVTQNGGSATAEPHGFAYYNLMAPSAAAFLVERLERELARVV